MILFGCAKLYELGAAIQTIKSISSPLGTTLDQLSKLVISKETLNSFLHDDSFRDSLEVAVKPAQKLITEIDGVLDRLTRHIPTGDNAPKKIFLEPVEFDLSTPLAEFEHVFKEEINIWNTFIVTPVGDYDPKLLVNDGAKFFEKAGLENLCPEAAEDLRAGARCLAFDLYTASGFHFHRANESVVLKYMEHLEAEPKNRNLAEYIKALREKGASEEILACLSSLKDLYRNPLMHPEESIDNQLDAVALKGHIQTSIISILKMMAENT